MVQVYGENIRRATLGYFDQGRGVTGRVHRAVVGRGLSRAFARLEHTLGALTEEGEAIRLPPIVPVPTNASRGRDGSERAVVYLNPHFRDGAIAEAIEVAVAERGLTLHGVAEGFAERPGWRAHDPALVDAVASASVFITGAGMGGLGMARAFAVPTVCLVTHQPEQRANARQIEADRAIATIAMPTEAPLLAELGAAMERVRAASTKRPSIDPSHEAQRIQQRWVDTFLELLARASQPSTTQRSNPPYFPPPWSWRPTTYEGGTTRPRSPRAWPACSPTCVSRATRGPSWPRWSSPTTD